MTAGENSNTIAFPAAGTCRGCGQVALQRMFSLGEVPGVNAFMRPDELDQERPHPLDVAWCQECTLVQLESIVPPADLFSHYQHLSSASQSNANHLAGVADRLIKQLHVGSSTKVMEIGSNDGTLLGAFKPATSHLLGVDPAHNLADYAREKGVEPISAFFDTTVADQIVSERGPQDLVMALNVVAHTPDVNGLLAAVSRVLAPDGTFIMEAVYVYRTILHGEFDTIYHEHVYCFSLTSLLPLLARVGLAVVDVEELPTQGGSLRVIARHAERQPPVADSVARLLEAEANEGVRDASTYERVGERVRRFKEEVTTKLDALRSSHDCVFGLGAPARGVVILNYCGIGPDRLDAVVDDTPLKQGRMVPGIHIPVVDWQAVADRQPSAYLLLSWNYQREILAKLRQHVDTAEILVPFPEICTVSVSPEQPDGALEY